MSSKVNRDRQALVADVSFALMGIISAIGLIADSFDTTPTLPGAPDPWLTGVGAVVLMVTVGLIVTRATSLDRRCAEEYTYQLMASAAVVSVMTTLILTFAWSNDLLLGRWLGEPSISQVLTLMLGSWSVGYFTFRVRGVRE